tara:strand:- start:445 stop:798 length:354 start_codon:yes stop_codon:yes gene_type:complete
MLIIYLKIFRNNYFVTISNKQANILFSRSSGLQGLTNTNKKKIESLNLILNDCFKHILNLKKKNTIYLKIDVFFKYTLYNIYVKFLQFFNKYKIKFSILNIINKISYAGCRKKLLKN